MKIGFDVSIVTVSLVTCLIFIKSFGSVGIGTIIAAVLVGMELGYITKCFGNLRDGWLKNKEEVGIVCGCPFWKRKGGRYEHT